MNRSWGEIVTTVAVVILAACAVAAMVWSFVIAKPSDVPWSDLIPALVGGAIGALAGGIPAYFIAKLGSREVLARDRAARLDQEKAAAFRAHVRVAELVNGILSLELQLEGMLSDAADNPQAIEHPWLVVRPIAGLSEERVPTVDASEAAVFVAAGATDYVNDLLLLPQRYLALIGALKMYEQKRERLTELMPAPQAFEDEFGSSFLTEGQITTLMPKMIELNSIIIQTRSFLSKDKEIALRLARDFGPILKKHFKDETFPGFDLDQVQPPVAPPQIPAEDSVTGT